MFFEVFMQLADTFQYLNPKLVLVNGAQYGQDINDINNPTASFWTADIPQKLADSNLTAQQVQVVWFKEGEQNPSDTTFPSYPISFKDKCKNVMQIIKNKFPTERSKN